MIQLHSLKREGLWNSFVLCKLVDPKTCAIVTKVGNIYQKTFVVYNNLQLDYSRVGSHCRVCRLTSYLSALGFYEFFNWKKIPVWNIKLAKSKIPVRVVKNVISKWTKIWFPRFQFLWFTAVGVVNPPDQKLIMYISVNCKKGMNSWARSIKIFYPSSETWKKIQFELVKITSLFSN